MKSQGQSFRRANAGFTLIELVIVIAILGVLAAVAVPKFVALQTDSRISKLKAARSAVAAAAANVHSAYLSRSEIADTVVCPGDGTNKADNKASGTVCTEPGLITLANAYPASSALGTAGIVSAAGLALSNFKPTLAQLNLEGMGASVAAGPPGVTTISVIGGPDTTGTSGAQVNATCSFTYTEPTVAGAPPAITVVTTSGC